MNHSFSILALQSCFSVVSIEKCLYFMFAVCGYDPVDISKLSYEVERNCLYTSLHRGKKT